MRMYTLQQPKMKTKSKADPYASELSKEIQISGKSYDAKNNKVGEL